MTSPYTLSDAGISGPGLSAAVPLDLIRSRPEIVLDALNVAELSGYKRGLDRGGEIMSESLDGALSSKLARADSLIDAKALGPMLADMGVDNAS